MTQELSPTKLEFQELQMSQKNPIVLACHRTIICTMFSFWNRDLLATESTPFGFL